MSEQTEINPTLEEQPEAEVPSAHISQPPEIQPSGGSRLTRKFVAGFLGWYLVIGLIYGLLLHGEPDPQGYGSMLISLLVFPVQIGALIILFLVKAFRNIGWGMLSAIAVNLLISLLMGMGLNAVCFIPFFTGTN